MHPAMFEAMADQTVRERIAHRSARVELARPRRWREHLRRLVFAGPRSERELRRRGTGRVLAAEAGE